MFENIGEPTHIYMHLDYGIKKVKLEKFCKIDKETIYVKAHDVGHLIFDKSFKCQKGNMLFSLSEECLKNQKYLDLKNKKVRIQQSLEKHKVDTIDAVNKVIQLNEQISKLEQDLEDVKLKILEEQNRIAIVKLIKSDF